MTKCVTCGKPFDTTYTRRTKYCSEECVLDAIREKSRNRRRSMSPDGKRTYQVLYRHNTINKAIKSIGGKCECGCDDLSHLRLVYSNTYSNNGEKTIDIARQILNVSLFGVIVICKTCLTSKRLELKTGERKHKIIWQ